MTAPTIGLVAGEQSGDLLGAALMDGLDAALPDARFLGIGGEAMQARGLKSLYPIERLSVMGLVEVVGRLPELLRQRKAMVARLLSERPAVFVGIDAPDYNLGLERRLKAGGVPVIHYVSPSVWAWRSYRVRHMAECVDRVLCLFPFEVDFYRRHGIPATFVGHPLAEQIPMRPDPAAARRNLGIPAEGAFVALLPGSRFSEVKLLWPVLLDTARWLQRRRPEIRFVAPAATEKLQHFMQQVSQPYGELDLRIIRGRSREAMEAADVVVLASGTAALEALLLKRPAVVTYRVNPLTAFLVRRMQTARYYSLPNNLAGRELYPERMQEQCRPEVLGAEVLCYLDEPDRMDALQEAAADIHQSLRADGKNLAAQTVLELVGE